MRGVPGRGWGEQISADPRSRRRRTIAKDQLALALGGAADHAWAVSFIVTNIPASAADYAGLEAWFRRRTSIAERFREAKLGAGLLHLPSADATVNTVWTWAGLLAGALNVILQALTGLDRLPERPGRHRIATLRHQLLAVPDQHTLPAVLARLRALPAPTWTPSPDPTTQGPGATDQRAGRPTTPPLTRRRKFRPVHPNPSWSSSELRISVWQDRHRIVISSLAMW
jgi:hypothetical protein